MRGRGLRGLSSRNSPLLISIAHLSKSDVLKIIPSLLLIYFPFFRFHTVSNFKRDYSENQNFRLVKRTQSYKMQSVYFSSYNSFQKAVSRWTKTISAKRQMKTFAVSYESFGNPVKVLQGKEIELPKVESGHVLTKLLAAPINPADINMIQGIYAVKPKSFPAVGGNESVSEVVEISDDVKSLQVGDWVVPAKSGSGTWQCMKVVQESDLIKVPNNIPAVSAATFTVNPRTAYRMLMDFEQLQPGDVVLQNGANSAVGQAVIQIAAKLDLQTINVIRDRPNISEVIQQLKDVGASHVVKSDILHKDEGKELMEKLPKAKLALNCVGGKQTVEMCKFLENGRTLVTYGGMSKQPLMVPVGHLIFKDIKIRGFWITQWTKNNFESTENQKMNNFLIDMIKSGELKAPFHRTVDITDFTEAVERSMTPFTSEKQILVQ